MNKHTFSEVSGLLRNDLYFTGLACLGKISRNGRTKTLRLVTPDKILRLSFHMPERGRSYRFDDKRCYFTISIKDKTTGATVL